MSRPEKQRKVLQPPVLHDFKPTGIPKRFLESLRRRNALERIGGAAYLSGLVEGVPATSNVDYYAEIVEEHALRRRLMRAGGVVADVVDLDLCEVVDRLVTGGPSGEVEP